VFAAALPDGRTAVVKVLDGAPRALAPVVGAVLRRLGGPGVDGSALDEATRTAVLGHGTPVGWVEPLLGPTAI
jgi:L-asparaginase II